MPKPKVASKPKPAAKPQPKGKPAAKEPVVRDSLDGQTKEPRVINQARDEAALDQSGKGVRNVVKPGVGTLTHSNGQSFDFHTIPFGVCVVATGFHGISRTELRETEARYLWKRLKLQGFKELQVESNGNGSK
jgi:hypothetical protein